MSTPTPTPSPTPTPTPTYDPWFHEIDENYVSEDEDIIWKRSPYSLTFLAKREVRVIDCSLICGKFDCLAQYAKDSIGWMRIDTGIVIHRFQGKALDEIRRKHPDVHQFSNTHWVD